MRGPTTRRIHKGGSYKRVGSGEGLGDVINVADATGELRFDLSDCAPLARPLLEVEISDLEI
jgi:hypothetical protein